MTFESREAFRVCCLPVAGNENPYQFLMMKGLRESGLNVRHGVDGKFFAGIRTVIRYRPDVLHFDWIYRYYLHRNAFLTWAHSLLFFIDIWLVRRIFRCRLVWTLHNIDTHDEAPTRWERQVRSQFAKSCEWVRVFHGSTKTRAASVLGIPEESFQVLPEGSYVDFYPNTTSKSEARAKLGISESDFVLLYLGAVRPYKGIEDLVDAFAAVREASWRLLIAGVPQDSKYADMLSTRCYQLHGVDTFFRFILEEELQVFFNACDVVALPFKNIENSGSVILAMGFGRAVLAPRIGVLPYRLSCQPELVYEPGSLKSALAKLSAITKARLDEIGAENFRQVERHAWTDFYTLFSPWVSSSSQLRTRGSSGSRTQIEAKSQFDPSETADESIIEDTTADESRPPTN